MAVVLLLGCAKQEPPVPATRLPQPTAMSKQPDLLDEFAKRPPKESRRDKNGQFVHAKYQHFEVDEAVAALSDVSRPWTVEKMLTLYSQEKDPKRKSRILWILAASRDPRAAIILGQDLKHDALTCRVAATYGIMHFFMDRLVSGGTEGHMLAAQDWWEKNEQRIRTEAKRKKTTTP